MGGTSPGTVAGRSAATPAAPGPRYARAIATPFRRRPSTVTSKSRARMSSTGAPFRSTTMASTTSAGSAPRLAGGSWGSPGGRCGPAARSEEVWPAPAATRHSGHTTIATRTTLSSMVSPSRGQAVGARRPGAPGTHYTPRPGEPPGPCAAAALERLVALDGTRFAVSRVEESSGRDVQAGDRGIGGPDAVHHRHLALRPGQHLHRHHPLEGARGPV